MHTLCRARFNRCPRRGLDARFRGHDGEVIDSPMAIETDATPSHSPPVVATRRVDVVVSLLLLGLACLLGWDSWRTGMSWADDGPQAGYFPFYLSVLMGAASAYGLATALVARAAESKPFVLRDQFGRVLQVFVPTLLYCLVMQFLGLYVASFLLIAGFMWWIGKI